MANHTSTTKSSSSSQKQLQQQGSTKQPKSKDSSQQQQQQEQPKLFTATFTPATNSSIPLNLVTYFGRVYTLYDALLLVEACRLDILPTIDRRLTTFERLKFIKPNCIFIWNETKSGMKRWTDGKLWSASKVLFGNFLQYREINKVTKKPEYYGLIKQSFSITTKDGQRFHLISYYQLNNPTNTATKTHNHQQQSLYANGTPASIPSPDINGEGEDNGNVLKKRKLSSGESGSIQLMDDYEDGYIVCIPSHDPKLKKLSLSNDVYPSHTLHAIPKILRNGGGSHDAATTATSTNKTTHTKVTTNSNPNITTPSTPLSMSNKESKDDSFSVHAEDESSVSTTPVANNKSEHPLAPGAIGYNNLSSQQGHNHRQQHQQQPPPPPPPPQLPTLPLQPLGQQQPSQPLGQQVPTYTNLQDSLQKYSPLGTAAGQPAATAPSATSQAYPTIASFPHPSKSQYSQQPASTGNATNSAYPNYYNHAPPTTTTTSASPNFQYSQTSPIPPTVPSASTNPLNFKFNDNDYIRNCDLQIVDILNKGFLK